MGNILNKPVDIPTIERQRIKHGTIKREKFSRVFVYRVNK